MSSRKYYYYCRTIGDPSEAYWRSIGDNMPDWRPTGDQHVWLETHRRQTCLIGNPLDTNMPHWRHMRHRHASSETNMPDRRPIGDRHASLENLIPGWRPIIDQQNQNLHPQLQGVNTWPVRMEKKTLIWAWALISISLVIRLSGLLSLSAATPPPPSYCCETIFQNVE